MGEVRQVEVGLHNLQERLTAVQATLDATQRSLALFLDTQEALNLVRSFRSCPYAPRGTHLTRTARVCCRIV
jgi:outer membrane protein TolC